MGQRGSSGFDSERRAVSARMALALAATLAIWLIARAVPLSGDIDRGRMLAAALLSPAACLAGGIAFIARHRFTHPGAIDGDDPADDETLRRAQVYLGNTAEQALLAGLAYVAMAFALPPELMAALPLSALAFAAGRIGFALGVGHPARRRALGFALTFYPTLAGLAASALLLLVSGR